MKMAENPSSKRKLSSRLNTNFLFSFERELLARMRLRQQT